MEEALHARPGELERKLSGGWRGFAGISDGEAPDGVPPLIEASRALREALIGSGKLGGVGMVGIEDAALYETVTGSSANEDEGAEGLGIAEGIEKGDHAAGRVTDEDPRWQMEGEAGSFEVSGERFHGEINRPAGGRGASNITPIDGIEGEVRGEGFGEGASGVHFGVLVGKAGGWAVTGGLVGERATVDGEERTHWVVLCSCCIRRA